MHFRLSDLAIFLLSTHCTQPASVSSVNTNYIIYFTMPARLPVGSPLIRLPSMFVITFSMSSSCPLYMCQTHDDYCFAPLLHVSMMAQFPLRATLSFSQSTNSQKYSPIAQLENINIFHPVFRLIMIHIRSSLVGR